jgi:lipid-A-disaccharide synthase
VKVFISAGEASGDMHAAEVIKTLFAHNPLARISGIAGPAMRQAGCQALADMNELNVMGLVDVLKNLSRIARVRRQVLVTLERDRPDVAILVDFPGFHMNLGTHLKARGIPVVQYIAPKLWAWGAWRAGKLLRSQDALASILPFERNWFEQRGIRAEYVGNPSAAACREGWNQKEFHHLSGLQGEGPVLAILPGSRPSELAHHVPLLAEAWAKLHAQRPMLRAIVPLAPGVDADLLAPLTRQDNVQAIDRMQAGYRLYADAAVAVSGTATLELALWDIPTVLVYRTSPFTIFMARRVVKLSHIGLANLLLDKTAMPELIQEQATVNNIVERIGELLDNPAACRGQRQDFAELRTLLGGMNPAEEVARMALELAGRALPD